MESGRYEKTFFSGTSLVAQYRPGSSGSASYFKSKYRWVACDRITYSTHIRRYQYQCIVTKRLKRESRGFHSISLEFRFWKKSLMTGQKNWTFIKCDFSNSKSCISAVVGDRSSSQNQSITKIDLKKHADFQWSQTVKSSLLGLQWPVDISCADLLV